LDSNGLRDLGDGLALRRATPADVERLVAFQSIVHTGDGPADIGAMAGAWCRDLLTKPHPTLTPDDYVLVEDRAAGEIVSSLCIIPQTWRYGPVEFGVGRPELVGTLPAYRRRGLVRAQMEEVHRRSSERGDLVQAITGIPYFYRQFGYEMALELAASRWCAGADIPGLPEGSDEPYRVRPARHGDLPFIARTHAEGARRWLVNCTRGIRELRYELSGQAVGNLMRADLAVVTEPDGRRIGFVAHMAPPWDSSRAAVAFEVAEGEPWWRVTPSVLRYLRDGGRPGGRAKGERPARVALSLGTSHPAYATTRGLLRHEERGFAWYLRVPDLPAFLRHVAPVLEERLRRSAMVGYTGDLKLNFYRGGVRMAFEAGHMAAVEAWTPTRDDDGSAAFPDLTFLQVLFGFRSLDDLRQAHPDCYVTKEDDAGALVEALFPKQPSHVWPLS
jgi:hypothetical protein